MFFRENKFHFTKFMEFLLLKSIRKNKVKELRKRILRCKSDELVLRFFNRSDRNSDP